MCSENLPQNPASSVSLDLSFSSGVICPPKDLKIKMKSLQKWNWHIHRLGNERLEEMSHNKESMCQQYPAAVSENQAVFCWVLMGKHPHKLDETNSHYGKDRVLSWRPEQEALWRWSAAAQGADPSHSSHSPCSLQAQGHSKAKATFHFPLPTGGHRQAGGSAELMPLYSFGETGGKKRIFKVQLLTERCCYETSPCFQRAFCFPRADPDSSVKGMEILQPQSWYRWR